MDSGRNAEVVVVGNVGIDTNVYLARPPDLSQEDHFTENVDYLGQPGGYTSRGFRRLGLATSFIGHVGDDPLGTWVRTELAGDGIDLTGLAIDPAGTGRCVNLMGPDGSRVSFYDGRGHRSLSVDPAGAGEIFAGASLAMFHLPDWARHLLPVARQAGAVIACDLQDVRDPDDEYLQDFLDGSDVLFVSSAHHRNPAHHRPADGEQLRRRRRASPRQGRGARAAHPLDESLARPGGLGRFVGADRRSARSAGTRHLQRGRDAHRRAAGNQARRISGRTDAHSGPRIRRPRP